MEGRRLSASGWISIDGRLLRAARARVSALDRGLRFGDAAFETIRVYGGHPFLWSRHERRLRATLRALRFPPLEADLRAAALAVVRRSRLAEAALRITVTRGPGGELLPPPGLRPTVLVVARPLPADLASRRERGVAVVTLPFGRGVGAATDGRKTTCYAGAVLGRIEASRRGASEALYVERGGCVSEATTSNVFALRRGRLETPPLSSGCLAGIARNLVLELARRDGLAVREGTLRPADLLAADELFLTGSVIEVMPVTRLDGRPIGRGRPGPVTRRLQDLYAARIARALASARSRHHPTRGRRAMARPRRP